jgi:hypothetical protein
MPYSGDQGYRGNPPLEATGAGSRQNYPAPPWLGTNLYHGSHDNRGNSRPDVPSFRQATYDPPQDLNPTYSNTQNLARPQARYATQQRLPPLTQSNLERSSDNHAHPSHTQHGGFIAHRPSPQVTPQQYHYKEQTQDYVFTRKANEDDRYRPNISAHQEQQDIHQDSRGDSRAYVTYDDDGTCWDRG